MVYTPRTNQAHLEFYGWYLSSFEFQRRLERVATGTTNSHVRVRPAETLSWTVPLPPLAEQRRIAAILDSADEAIEETEALIFKLKQTKNGLMHDLLTRGIDEHGRLRCPEVTPKQFKDSPLGKLPRAWEICSFGRLTDFAALGTTARGSSATAKDIPLLKMGNLGWGQLDVSKVEYVDRDLLPPKEAAPLRYRDFLFNTRNTPELVGKTAVWSNELSEAVHDNNLLRVRFKSGVVSPYVCAYMSTGSGKRRVHALSTGTTSVAAIYWKNLSNYPVPIPTEAEQERMVSVLEAQDDRIRAEEAYRDKFVLQKRGLMDDLLTGRVRVYVGGEGAA